ncbi:CBS domain-containing protein [Clostridium aciditolerans]|uniref:CBS domain-containing protein n=1 Tax=Clostridium aciditolerans TaxID=339861 RepID=A0A934M1U7_9CLOT|nr:CBS domain-containing protein [Clostridium aciditolerans]MBI6871467.1 CBS domain-containing protein [Clostridium aciditolerans]
MLSKIITYDIIKLSPNDTLIKALEIMNDNNINGAPVVDDNGLLVGMIVKADIYRFLMDQGHYDTCPVEWVMTKKVITASKDEDVIVIAKRLRENDIIAIPIVDNNTILGLATIENIVDYFIETYGK